MDRVGNSLELFGKKLGERLLSADQGAKIGKNSEETISGRSLPQAEKDQ